MSSHLDISAIAMLRQDAEALARFFDEFLAAQSQAPQRLLEAIQYSLTAGGKRLRPALLLETFRCISSTSPLAALDIHLPSALAAAGAIELIHTFSLVHDDLPSMDNDDFRRGVPTNHKVFGEAMAILAGDAMVTLAFELLAAQARHEVAPRLMLELTRAAGPQGMIGGQVLDMEGENKRLDLSELQMLHRKKTGALLTCAARMGAIAAGASEPQLDAVSRFGQHLGLAFQIIDDLLDVTATPAQLGKATQKDAVRGKNTYPALLGVEGARQEAESQLQLALGALDPFSERSGGLRALASFVVHRSS